MPMQHATKPFLQEYKRPVHAVKPPLAGVEMKDNLRTTSSFSQQEPGSENGNSGNSQTQTLSQITALLPMFSIDDQYLGKRTSDADLADNITIS